LINDRDRAYFGRDDQEEDKIGFLDETTRAIFGRSYAAEPDILIEQLRKDEAIAEADTLLLTIPNQLGVDYNAHVMEAILTTVWLARNLAVDPFHSIGGSKWQAPRERLVQSDAQGVEIAARINRAIHPTGLFGGHIGEGEQLAGPGAMQFRSGAEVEKFSQKDGLSADDTSAVLEDREPIDEEIPAQLSAIMTRLLAKTVEERYQTAVGLEADLRRCLAEWETQSHIAPFPLGKHDVPDRLLIPEKLYGREHEVNTLAAAFDRVVAHGTPELVLVSGYSGVGNPRL
jgi:hypothetical protein